jgi:hypothetical protein
LLTNWHELPAGLRAAHTVPLSAVGEFEVFRGNGWFANRVADVLRLPSAGKARTVRLIIEPFGARAKWMRSFDGRGYPSTFQWSENGKLFERAGKAVYVFEIVGNEDAIEYKQEEFRLIGIAMPKRLSMHVWAKVTPDGEGWHVEVTIHAPFVGLLCRYAGNMRAE